MPRDIDDQTRRRDRERAHGEISSDEMRDPDMSGSDMSDPDMGSSGTRREHDEKRSSWDDDEEDRQGYR
jgi:hypothetical protein